MQYIAVDLSLPNPTVVYYTNAVVADAIFKELEGGYSVYDKRSEDITYVIFNDFLLKSYNHDERSWFVLGLICPRNKPPVSFFGNLPIHILESGSSYSYGSTIVLSKPQHVSNRHDFYMIMFSITEIQNFPDDVISQIMFRIDRF